MPKTPSETDLANVQNYLLWKGHACPTIVGDKVHYIDQTKGFHRVWRSLTIESLLEEIQLLKLVDSDHYADKSAFAAGSLRLRVDDYQLMEIKGKLFYREDLPLLLRNKNVF